MASRMDKYHDKESQYTKRSQRNRFLYDFLEANNPKSMSALDKEIEARIERLEKLFSNYEKYKYTKRENISSDRINTYQNSNQYSIAPSLKKDTSNHKPRANIEELLHTLSKANQLKQSQVNVQSSVHNDLRKRENIEALFQKKEPIQKVKKSSPLQNKVSEKDQRRKINLRIKRIVGIIFLINCFLIIILIYRAVR